jgi:hypothetical protein
MGLISRPQDGRFPRWRVGLVFSDRVGRLGFFLPGIRAILRRFRFLTCREAIMRRALVIVLGWSLGGMAELAAEDLAALRPAQRKAAVESKLDQPLQWDLADREQVTLAEFMEFVQEKHGLKIRWDAGSLALFQGEQAPQFGLFPIPASQPAYYPAHPTSYASDPLTAPPPLASDVTYFPIPPESAKPVAAPVPSQPASPKTLAPAPYPARSSYAPSPATPAHDDAPPPDLPATGQPAGGSPPKILPSTPPANAGPPGTAEPEADGRDAAQGNEELLATFGETPIAVSALALTDATVREGLKQLLDALPAAAGAALQLGLPITTRALKLDLLVDENSVLITTQLRANAAKETRVYRLGALGEMPPETLVRVITHSVRPWSWRSQAHEIAEQLASRWPKTPLPLPKVEFNMTEGVKLALSEGAAAPQPAAALPAASEAAVAATGQLLAGGAVAALDTVVAALEIVHHGDPPTGVIEVLPGALVITQSQAAHREIEELLDALRAEN